MTSVPIASPIETAERLVVLGQIITLRATTPGTSGACMIFDLEAAPGLGVPCHVHDHEDELFVVYRGTARFVVDGSEILVGPGGSLFAPRQVPHEWWVIGDEPLVATTTVLPGKLDDMFRELATLPEGRPDLDHVAAICAPHGVRFV